MIEKVFDIKECLLTFYNNDRQDAFCVFGDILHNYYQALDEVVFSELKKLWEPQKTKGVISLIHHNGLPELCVDVKCGDNTLRQMYAVQHDIYLTSVFSHDEIQALYRKEKIPCKFDFTIPKNHDVLQVQLFIKPDMVILSTPSPQEQDERTMNDLLSTLLSKYQSLDSTNTTDDNVYTQVTITDRKMWEAEDSRFELTVTCFVDGGYEVIEVTRDFLLLTEIEKYWSAESIMFAYLTEVQFETRVDFITTDVKCHA